MTHIHLSQYSPQEPSVMQPTFRGRNDSNLSREHQDLKMVSPGDCLISKAQNIPLKAGTKISMQDASQAQALAIQASKTYLPEHLKSKCKTTADDTKTDAVSGRRFAIQKNQMTPIRAGGKFGVPEVDLTRAAFPPSAKQNREAVNPISLKTQIRQRADAVQGDKELALQIDQFETYHAQHLEFAPPDMGDPEEAQHEMDHNDAASPPESDDLVQPLSLKGDSESFLHM